MEHDELEEKVTMAEELILGLVKRMEVIESELPEFLKTFLQQYKETLANISGQIEKSNERYDDQKISQQIDQVKDLVGTIPKVITVKNDHHHHFGAWSKNLIIGVAACVLVTALSTGTALYLNHENNHLAANDIKFRAIRQIAPRWGHWADTTYSRNPKVMEENTIKLETEALEKAYAEEVARETAEEAKRAKKRLHSLKKKD
ncbi:hypothetical protein [Pedobacter sp. N23S346]|uniref:hypothetical protein n=1 Tax=Pedobacter sp. N23S346 TaxID=3402750 RepID=UPI003AC04C5F